MAQPPFETIKRKYTTEKPGNVADAKYFYFDTTPQDHKNLAIVCGGMEQCAPDFDINRSNYPYYFIKYTVSGRGTLRIDSKTYVLGPGALTGFGPGTAHHYKADPHNPMHHMFVTFIGDECPSLFEKSDLFNNHYIRAENPDEIMRVFSKILHLGFEKNAHAQEICCAYLRILLLEHAACSVRDSARFPISQATYQSCKKYIDTHFSSLKSPGHAAAGCNVDVRYLSVLFKRYCHVAPRQYMMRLKLNKAANLLLTTGLTVKEIAFQVGFDDPYHFSKNFKKLHGRSPDHFRKNHM